MKKLRPHVKALNLKRAKRKNKQPWIPCRERESRKVWDRRRGVCKRKLVELLPEESAKLICSWKRRTA